VSSKYDDNAAREITDHNIEPTDDEDDISPKLQSLTRGFQNLHVGGFHGKSSGATLLKTIIDVKAKVYGDLPINPRPYRQDYWSLLPVSQYQEGRCALLNEVFSGSAMPTRTAVRSTCSRSRTFSRTLSTRTLKIQTSSSLSYTGQHSNRAF
jgi:hypothetical protein